MITRFRDKLCKVMPRKHVRNTGIILIVFIFYWKSLSSSSERSWKESGFRTNLLHADDNSLGAFFLFLCPSPVPGFPWVKLMFQIHSYQTLLFLSFHPFRQKKLAELVRPTSHRQALSGSENLFLFPLLCLNSSSGLLNLYMSVIKWIVRQINKCITLTLWWVKT